MSGGIGGAPQFAMDFLGVAMTAQLGQQCVGGFRASDVFGSEQSGKPPLPVLVLPFDFTFGLGRAGVTQGDAVEVQGGPQLRAMAIANTEINRYLTNPFLPYFHSGQKHLNNI